MPIRLIITYILNLVDLFFTNYWVNKYGLDAEANPFGRWLYGNALTYVFKVGVIGVFLFILYKGTKTHPSWTWASWLVLGVYTIVVIVHLVLYFKIKKN